MLAACELWAVGGDHQGFGGAGHHSLVPYPEACLRACCCWYTSFCPSRKECPDTNKKEKGKTVLLGDERPTVVTSAPLVWASKKWESGGWGGGFLCSQHQLLFALQLLSACFCTCCLRSSCLETMCNTGGTSEGCLAAQRISHGQAKLFLILCCLLCLAAGTQSVCQLRECT